MTRQRGSAETRASAGFVSFKFRASGICFASFEGQRLYLPNKSHVNAGFAEKSGCPDFLGFPKKRGTPPFTPAH
jgi:hypothetical protein